jgi:hypothetical protein
VREANHRERVELAQSTWIERLVATMPWGSAAVEGTAVEVS